MNVTELAFGIARSFLSHPDDPIVTVWRSGKLWGWGKPGESEPPHGARIVYCDRVHNADRDPTLDPDEIEAYAFEIRDWLLQRDDVPR